MYYRSEPDGRFCIGAGQMLGVHSPDGSTFQREMPSWLPSYNDDFISDIRLHKLTCVTRRTILPNFILIRFETMEPWTFLRSPQQEKQ